MHSAPPLPHIDVELPSTHTSPSQQPEQLSGPHVVGARQVPSLQVCPALQLLHRAPPRPHAALVLPATHSPAWQQPLHVCGPQLPDVGTHACATHCSLALHTSQVPPRWPHAVTDTPVTQVPALQQPSGHVDALHAPPSHSPSLQV